MNKPMILIVEDEADIRRFVRIALEKEGMNVFEAQTAEQARIDAATRKPNLAVIDLGLPDDDGKTLIREMRSWSTVPIPTRRTVRSRRSLEDSRRQLCARRHLGKFGTDADQVRGIAEVGFIFGNNIEK